MPNVTADTFGTVNATFVVNTLTLTGEKSIVGRSVILHADPDDYRSQPAGNSGPRIACGVILPI
jgi:Cu-Zn family superoxide dismutase